MQQRSPSLINDLTDQYSEIPADAVLEDADEGQARSLSATSPEQPPTTTVDKTLERKDLEKRFVKTCPRLTSHLTLVDNDVYESSIPSSAGE